ncbi:hypothetical protein HMH01_16065 [Halovulum dunhuangense]|uniref:Uncharacterized protein n=1 Tax=Halovulum dunhuangense TaxID=1505036 RepID=A0A849L6S7_9RHOB|nr:hypothetical protein [Halovulum dunhuangense]NNU81953.1 hypothetical protein [Halovulum dunhuangense]
MKRLLLVTAFWAGAAGLAPAASFNAPATGTATETSIAYQVSDGHVVVHNMSQYTAMLTADPENPMNGAAGPCFGVIEFRQGAVSGGGKCVYTDQGGDHMVIGWAATAVAETGATTGTWTLEGGSGKYLGSSGGGAFQTTGPGPDGTETNAITGEITLP